MGADPDAFRRAHLAATSISRSLASSSGSVENLERLGVASGLQPVLLALLLAPMKESPENGFACLSGPHGHRRERAR